MLIKRSDCIAALNDIESAEHLGNHSRIQATFLGQIYHFDEHDAWYENLVEPQISLVEYLTCSM